MLLLNRDIPLRVCVVAVFKDKHENVSQEGWPDDVFRSKTEVS